MNGDRGAVTVEAAVVVCGLLLLLSVVMAAMGAVLGQLRCTDAAREAARLVARGDPPDPAKRIAPGAALSVNQDGDGVRVTCTRPSPLPGLTVRAEAFAVLEPR